MSEYIKKEDLFNKTIKRNSIWNGTTNAEGKGLEEIVNDLPTYTFPDSAENKGKKKIGDLTLREIKQMCNKKLDKELIFSCVPCSGSEFCPCDYILKAPFLWDSADLEKELPRGDKAE